jgi:hypothetical protein
MSIERDSGQLLLVCDTCFTEVPVEDFDNALYFMHQHRWQRRKVNDEWYHECWDCQHDAFDFED